MGAAPIEAGGPTRVRVAGVELIAFAGTGYLGLAHHPAVLAAAREALERDGLSPLASRATSGTLGVHVDLEEALAEFLGVEAALVLADGWLADVALLEVLGPELDLALLDADCHPSLVDAATRAPQRLDYGAGDRSRAHALLDRHRDARVAVLTDGVFPSAGRMAPLADLLRALPDDGWLVVDDSHGVGVLGPTGAGTASAFGLQDARLALTFSLAKALGAVGGAIAGSASLIERVRRRADSFLGTTALAPAAAAGARAALDVLAAEPQRLQRLHANAQRLHQLARDLGRPSGGTFLPSLYLPCEAPEAGRALEHALRKAGLFLPFIHYPGLGEAGALRVAVTSEHTPDDLDALEQAITRHYVPPQDVPPQA